MDWDDGERDGFCYCRRLRQMAQLGNVVLGPNQTSNKLLEKESEEAELSFIQIDRIINRRRIKTNYIKVSIKFVKSGS